MSKKLLYSLTFAFVVALLSMLGSLFFSEVLKMPPCTLCWYQRLTLYPPVFILGMGLWKQDKQVWRYALPFVIVGVFIAGYHNLLEIGIIPESLSPCTSGVSCLTRYINVFGFITIPLLSLGAHLAAAAALLIARKEARIQE